MRLPTAVVPIVVLVVTALPPARLPAQGTTAFIDVTVIPMDRERILEHQTVIVRDGRVAEMGPAGRVAIPSSARRIDGTGRYLVPGIAEMHAHLPPPRSGQGQLGRQWVEDVLFLYVANGVTTVRGMLGHPSHLELRRRAEAGALVAPRIWTSGPSINGNSVSTVDSAARTPRFQQRAGYDFMKIHPGLARAVFDALDAAGDRIGFGFSGHVPAAVGLRRALEAGYGSIDHLDRYVEYVAGAEHASVQESGFFGANLVERVDTARIAEVARRTRASGVWNVPTQTLMESYATAEPVASMAQRDELRYIPSPMRQTWIDWKRRTVGQGPPQAQRRRFIALRQRLIKTLHDEGAGLLLGSDAPQVWNVPGFSAHRELASLVAAGLTPYEALVTGTRNVAAFLGTETRAGTVAPGKNADFMLLEGNPLEDIANTRRRAGVMIRGVWLDGEHIQRRLDEIAARYGPGPEA